MSTSAHLNPIPDLAIVDKTAWRSDLRATTDPYSRVVPELIVEVISPANRKGAIQRLVQNYAEFGIREVLLFHTETRTYESHYGLELSPSAQTSLVAPLTTPTIDLDQLWTEFQATYRHS